MDCKYPTPSAPVQDDSITPNENERLLSSAPIEANEGAEVMPNARPTESVQTLPRGLVRDMISLYSMSSVDGKETCGSKPQPTALPSPDAPSRDGLNVSQPTECKENPFETQTEKVREDPACSVQLEDAKNQKSESSYMSKTIIAKTDEGVAITNEIFYEQDPLFYAVISGSRLVTHIPESRILNEFEEYTRRRGDKRH